MIRITHRFSIEVLMMDSRMVEKQSYIPQEQVVVELLLELVEEVAVELELVVVVDRLAGQLVVQLDSGWWHSSTSESFEENNCLNNVIHKEIQKCWQRED